jgi:hypothetical protein
MTSSWRNTAGETRALFVLRREEIAIDLCCQLGPMFLKLSKGSNDGNQKFSYALCPQLLRWWRATDLRL